LDHLFPDDGTKNHPETLVNTKETTPRKHPEEQTTIRLWRKLENSSILRIILQGVTFELADILDAVFDFERQ
jgi:hypothetical protein